VNKTAASATQLAKCILLHANSCTNAAPSCISTNKNLPYKLRTIEAENP